jgi:hypothetical protein
VRLTGNGMGALANPESFNLNIPQYLGAGTADMLALVRRPIDNPVPLLAFQHGVGSFGRELCISYELAPGQLVCNHVAPVQGPLAVGGKDKVSANGGDDTIFARDGARDTIDCGAGRDKVKADRSDTLKHASS